MLVPGRPRELLLGVDADRERIAQTVEVEERGMCGRGDVECSF